MREDNSRQTRKMNQMYIYINNNISSQSIVHVIFTNYNLAVIKKNIFNYQLLSKVKFMRRRKKFRFQCSTRPAQALLKNTQKLSTCHVHDRANDKYT